MARRLKNLGEEVAFLGLIDATPANAGYETIQWWNPHFPIRFIRNFKFWLDDFMTLPLAERQRFILRKSRSIGRKMLSRVGLRRSKNSVDLEEVIELSHFPEKELRLWQIHLNALSEHKQAPYSGAVTVLRTRGQALFCSLAEDFCWNKLVGSGVVLKTIPGSHENIFMEPHVRALAKELTSCLEHLQTQKELAAH